MSTAVIGATGRVGSEIVRGLLARGEPVTFRVAADRQYLDRLIAAGIPAGTAELLITREWAILAGENDYTTGTFAQITGRPPRPVTEFLHQYRAEFT
jgi:nucleoside-diphosphate-sugar epimerase